MKIPSDDAGRFALYEQLARDCMVSQSTRKSQYERWKRYYMFGCDDGINPSDVANKIYPHVDQLTSFMYAQETTRFAVQVGVSASGLNFGMVPPINQMVNEEWHNSDTDITFGSGLLWSWVWGTTLIKPVWRNGGIAPGLVHPHNFGVLREDCTKLTDQEAFVHEYLITKTQLRNELQAAMLCGAITAARVEKIMSRVESSGHTEGAGMTGPANIVITTIQPLLAGNDMTGGINPDHFVTPDYRPRVADPLIQMRELYVWNDDAGTYQVVTMAEPYVTIWDRPLQDQMGLRGEAPFIQICPCPAPDYFWGHSEVERLIPLQDMRNTRLAEIRKMLALQADPPWDFAGLTVTDEIMQAFNTPGGRVASDMPAAKANAHPPQFPQDLWADIREIDGMFDEMSGISGILSGRGASGSRSNAQASTMARIGSSRAKKRAMIIEDALDNLATYYLKLMRQFSDARMRTSPLEQKEQSVEFILKQFTSDFTVSVDGHSSSPIFVEDEKQLVFALLKLHLIDRETAIEMLPLPGKQLLRTRLERKIKPAEAEHAEQEEKFKLALATKQHHR